MLPQNNPQTLQEWAGAQYLTLTLVFTDIVDSTAIGIKLGDRKWIEDLFKHFFHARQIASKLDCYVVKVIGDSFMIAFRTPTDAVNFALEFSANTGVEYISIRAAIHSGQVEIKENDIYGLNVNFTARVQHEIPIGIMVSDSVRRDFVKTYGVNSTEIQFEQKEANLKSFGQETLWKVWSPRWAKEARNQHLARRLILNPNIQTHK